MCEEVLGSEGQRDTFEGLERRETVPGLSIHLFSVTDSTTTTGRLDALGAVQPDNIYRLNVEHANTAVGCVQEGSPPIYFEIVVYYY